mmetsp:Transcript_35880/g.30172  ORF Transcript_35880/g.30172 Transcript_35880/m.30172 type:complete len:217 (-) Transcript_35880:142-792(-)
MSHPHHTDHTHCRNARQDHQPRSSLGRQGASSLSRYPSSSLSRYPPSSLSIHDTTCHCPSHALALWEATHGRGVIDETHETRCLSDQTHQTSCLEHLPCRPILRNLQRLAPWRGLCYLASWSPKIAWAWSMVEWDCFVSLQTLRHVRSHLQQPCARRSRRYRQIRHHQIHTSWWCQLVHIQPLLCVLAQQAAANCDTHCANRHHCRHHYPRLACLE